jgi:MoaA/NifB/PqqE/SkfB family radical SAM enzyme
LRTRLLNLALNHNNKVLSRILYFISNGTFKTKSGTIRLEASSMCQLKCPICSTGNGNNRNGVVGWGFLKFADFKKFIDDNPEIRNIELSNWGEIFLNPELRQIIEYSYLKQISLRAGNGVNLNTINEDLIESLVKFCFKHLTVSIDGASNETYKIYRVNGDYSKVISNIRKINHYKLKYNSEYPKLCWQFVIFGHNENEIAKARQMAKMLNMNFKLKLNWDSSYSPIKDRDYVRRESGLEFSTREEYKQKNKREYKLSCTQLWTSPQINWDGKLLGCCVNKYSDFGNVFEKEFKECIKNEKYSYAKKMLLGLKGRRNDIACSQCPIYQKKFKTC